MPSPPRRKMATLMLLQTVFAALVVFVSYVYYRIYVHYRTQRDLADKKC